MKDLDTFCRKKDFLICVDSDGCAMDAMEIKHKKCFGPLMIEEWRLQEWETPLLEYWNRLNLYSMTRGINRFQGLAKALTEADSRFTSIDDLPALVRWAASAPRLSEQALREAIAHSKSIALAKALHWSQSVNRSIHRLPPEAVKPFPAVREGLERAAEYADIVMVSSANREAVAGEWERYGLSCFLNLLLAQDSGSKSHCIGALLKKGYAPEHVLMIGDAPGDLEAARENNVLFYPILARKENESWENFAAEILGQFMTGAYAGSEKDAVRKFVDNLSDQV